MGDVLIFFLPSPQWDQFIELGKDIPDSQIEDLISAQKPKDCCLLVYTVREVASLRNED